MYRADDPRVCTVCIHRENKHREDAWTASSYHARRPHIGAPACTIGACPLSFQAEMAMRVSSRSSNGAVAAKYSKKSGAARRARTKRACPGDGSTEQHDGRPKMNSPPKPPCGLHGRYNKENNLAIRHDPLLLGRRPSTARLYPPSSSRPCGGRTMLRISGPVAISIVDGRTRPRNTENASKPSLNYTTSQKSIPARHDTRRGVPTQQVKRKKKKKKIQGCVL